MENILKPFLKKQRFVLLDGAFATELEALGADLNHPLWSAKILVEKPELVKAVHLSYLKAGANIISTSTYQASFEGFNQFGISLEESKDFFHKSVDLAVAARDEFIESNPGLKLKPLIAASLGPYGAYLANGAEYHGNYQVQNHELHKFHYDRIAVLLESKADLFLFETIPNRNEANLIGEIMNEIGSKIPSIICFSCKNGEHISDGNNFSTIVEEMNRYEKIIAVGVNCTSPRYIKKLLDAANEKTKKPLLVAPNSGESWCAVTKSWGSEKEKESTFSDLETWIKSGAKIIGGCCRTNPEQIKSLSIKLKKD